MIVRAHAAHLPLRDATVDLVVTSPPYFALRSYRDDGEHYAGQVGSEDTPGAFVDALLDATAEMIRVLKPTGSIIVNLGDKYAGSGGHNNASLMKATEGRGATGARRSAAQVGEYLRDAPTGYNKNSDVGGTSIPSKSLMGLPWRYANACIDQLGLILRAEIIWSKPNGLPESVKDRVRRSHETWFHLVKQGRYYSTLDDVREEGTGRRQAGGPLLERNEGHVLGRVTNPHCGMSSYEPNPLGKVPGSVWTIASEPLAIPDWARVKYGLPDHFAAFPQEWPRRLILGWSPPGGVVLDPFGGTGTVAMVARTLGRYGVNGDLSGDYCRLARWRIYESGHAAKSEDRTWRDAQGSML